MPDLFVEGRHEYLNSFTGGNYVRFGVILPLVDLGANRAGIALARGALEE